MTDQLDLFASAPKSEPIDEVLDDFRHCFAAIYYWQFNPFSSEAGELLFRLRDAPTMPKKELPYRLVEELRRHKMAVFTYEGKTVRCRLNTEHVIEVVRALCDRAYRWCS